jgi:hypothetical protein
VVLVIGIVRETAIGKERGIGIERGKGKGTGIGRESREKVEAKVPKNVMGHNLAKGLKIGSKKGRRNDPVCVYKL